MAPTLRRTDLLGKTKNIQASSHEPAITSTAFTVAHLSALSVAVTLDYREEL